jgi:hypothetical protein
MTTTIKYLAPWLAAAAIGGTIALAPIAGAAAPARATTTVTHHDPDTGTDPLVPYGTEPEVPYRLGYINPNHDQGNTTNGELDLPF